jgi:hypothetical protein
MQPTTFAFALPSALSLYGLAFTVYRSAMPSFSGQLTTAQIRAVSQFVASAAGR